MTIKELEKIGIVPEGSNLKSRRFFVPYLGTGIVIPKSYTIYNILELIYDKGVELGIEKGKEMKAEEIRNALNIEKSED